MVWEQEMPLPPPALLRTLTLTSATSSTGSKARSSVTMPASSRISVQSRSLRMPAHLVRSCYSLGGRRRFIRGCRRPPFHSSIKQTHRTTFAIANLFLHWTCDHELGRMLSHPLNKKRARQACSSIVNALRILCPCGPIAQLVEQLAFNQWVAGSSPARLTTFPEKNSNRGWL
jgi:hypothetical protein